MTPAATDSAPAGWSLDDHAEALCAYQSTVDHMPEAWPRPGPNEEPRRFFEQAFKPAPQAGPVLLTGYYEPELPGALERSPRFPHPIFARPPGLTQPWFDRTVIEEGNLLAGHEIAWLESALEAFLAQVQGSLRVRLPCGAVRRFGYAARNGHPYASIGKELIRRGELAEADASVARIRDWAARNPTQVAGLLRVNPAFVFFRPLDHPANLGPIGSMGRPVTALRSIAVDPEHIPLGAPVWVEWEGQARLMIAQDTGSAIRGSGRGDIFFGTGEAAGTSAGRLRATGRMIVLLPKGLA